MRRRSRESLACAKASTLAVSATASPRGTAPRATVRTSLLGALLALCAVAAAPSAALAGECPNEARRVEQNATFLPKCRAYERVSPEEKGGGDIVADGETVIAATGGGAVTFNSRTPFGDTVGSGVSGQTTYVAHRNQSAMGWVTHAVTPTGPTEAAQTVFTSTKLELFSNDLSTALIWAYDLPDGGGVPMRNNIYTEETATRALHALAVPQTEAQLSPFEFINLQYAGISADAQHVAFIARAQLLSDAAVGWPNVYQSNNGVLSLAGVLPDGTVPTTGSTATAVLGEGGYRGAMSADGSRLLFMATPPSASNPQLYMRIDGERTAWISEPENSSEPVEPSEVHIQYMTPNGKYVFFVTNSKLLSEDENEGPDLYRWTYGPDPEHERNLTLITNSGEFTLDGISVGVVGSSEDGNIVYYDTANSNLAVWDDGNTRQVASVEVAPEPNESLAAIAAQPGYGRVSPDGAWLAFENGPTYLQEGLRGLTGQVTNGHNEMYVYSLTEDRLTCVSCPSKPASNETFVAPFLGDKTYESSITHGLPRLIDAGNRPQFLSDNGQVFFSTAEALLPQDTNGVTDVYEYDVHTKELSLLSRGIGDEPSAFANASANGEDVFVQTRQQLLTQDHDSLVDVYDVRVKGGFPAPATLGPCSADECHMQPAPAPSFGAPVTVGFFGAGNVSVPTSKSPVKGQSSRRKLAKALKVCKRKRNRARRKKCVARAKKHYDNNAKSARGSK